MREATIREKIFSEGMKDITEQMDQDPTAALGIVVGALALTVGEILVRAGLTTKEEFDELSEANFKYVEQFYKDGVAEELNRRLDQVEREVT